MENYQFIKQIGHGSYGETWLVKCSKTRKRHVLKRIDLHHLLKREQRAAYLEAKLVSTIKHPNIVTYLDTFHNSFDSLFIVMSYCECGDLYTYIKNKNGEHFEEKQIVHWFVQICLALKYLHDKNILHLKLQTKNIFLTKNKIIKIGDLGVSKLLNITYEMTSIEAPCYISPEVFAGEPHTEKSDVWALGCCLYEMATLKPPYVIQDIHSVMQNIIQKELSLLPEMYSEELYEIISSTLDFKSSNRPSITQLLLNDYVRRYILLTLQDNAKSPDSLNSETFCESSIGRSKSNSDLSLVTLRDTSSSMPRSKSTCLLSRNVNKASKTLGYLTKDRVKASESGIITVPDVNGNGDGNDNSQHGGNAHIYRKDCEKSSKISCDKNRNSTKNGKVFEEPTKLHLNAIPNGNNSLPSSSKNFETNAISKKQRMRGEISFQILNSLAYTLYTARPKNFDHIGVTNNNYSNSESSLVTNHSSYSFVHGHAEKQSVKKTAKTMHCEKERNKNNVCTLPQIKRESRNGRINKSTDDSSSLPHVKLQSSK